MIPMRNRRNQWVFAWQVFLSATLFWLGLILYPEALGAQVYGDIAQHVQAEGWAAAFMGSALLVIYGIHINGRWRWSPTLRLTGFGLLAFLFSGMVWSAVGAPTGVVIWAFTIPCFLVPCVRFLRQNIFDARDRWHDRRN